MHVRGTPPVDAALRRVHAGVVRLLSDLDRPPRTLRISAAGVSVELEWPDVPATGPAPEGTVPPEAKVPAEAHDGLTEIGAPAVGVFHRARGPEAVPFVSVGDRIDAGQQVAIVEAMKLMLPVESIVAGEVVEVLCDNGTSVEYGQPLFLVRPADQA